MKRFLTLCVMMAAYGCSNAQPVTLREALKDKFLIGTAMNAAQITGTDSRGVALIKQQFDAIVAENCMKPEALQSHEGVFDFTLADKFVDFGQANNMWITGHTLIWHQQVPSWFFVDSLGNEVSRDVLIERMKKHISTVVGRYKGRVKGWDVVNEAILDDGSWRETKFYKIIGEDYIELAFRFAHQADPDAELYYNDFSMANQGKRNAVVALVRKLQADGIRIDAVGMQGHMLMTFPEVVEFEKSLLAFAATGVKVMITEMDMTILPTPSPNAGAEVSNKFEYQAQMNPYPDGLPKAVADSMQARYADFFRLFLKHQDKISRVTMWGVTDADSWRNGWPIPGRTDYALLFDRNYQPKPIVEQIVKMAKQAK